MTYRDKKFMDNNSQSQYDIIKPIKSACFNQETYKAPTSSSIKERIKLNKLLTLSPKSGKLIGVSQHRKREQPQPLNFDNSQPQISQRYQI